MLNLLNTARQFTDCNKKYNIALFNVTSCFDHVGCQAVSNAHDSLLASHEIDVKYQYFSNQCQEFWLNDLSLSIRCVLASDLYNVLNNVDAVVVNGEGTIHHLGGKHLLVILAAAQVLQKPTYLLNAVLQECDGFDELLQQLHDLTVRDAFSSAYLWQKGIVHRFISDTIIDATFLENNHPCDQRKIFYTDAHPHRLDVQHQLNLIQHQYGSNAAYLPLEYAGAADTWQYSLSKIRGAKLVVTARHHGLYLAILAKIPFVVLPSNTWKLEGLLSLFGDPYQWIWLPGKDLYAMCEQALQYPEVFDKVFSSSFFQAPSGVFDKLLADFALLGDRQIQTHTHLLNYSEIVEKYLQDGDLYQQYQINALLTLENIDEIDRRVVDVCKNLSIFGRVLIIGSQAGALVKKLIAQGFDAYGLLDSSFEYAELNQDYSGRFFLMRANTIPFENDVFEVVLVANFLESQPFIYRDHWTKEIHRISNNVVLLIVYERVLSEKIQALSVCWESLFYVNNFRKHASYARVNPLSRRNQNCLGWIFPFQKISFQALSQATIKKIDLMDETRQSIYVATQQMAIWQRIAELIRPFDEVLCFYMALNACAYVLESESRAKKMIVVNHDALLHEYQQIFFSSQFVECFSFDAFEKSFHDTKKYYHALILSGSFLMSEMNFLENRIGIFPGGRLFIVVDENDLMVFWDEQQKSFRPSQYIDLSFFSSLVFENIFTFEASVSDANPVKFFLVVFVSTPLQKNISYEESVFSNLADSSHPSLNYEQSFENPWLMHAVVNVSYRIQNRDALSLVIDDILEHASATASNDYCAALCVKAYQVLDDNDGVSHVKHILSLIAKVIVVVPQSLMQLRWKISLLFVMAKLQQMIGLFESALQTFIDCASQEALSFGVHLTTKTTEAWFLAGQLAYQLKNIDQAKKCWQRCVTFSHELLSVSAQNILLNMDFPNLYHYGDGIREYTLAWDNITRCANALHCLSLGKPLDFRLVNACWQYEYNQVHQDLLQAHKYLSDYDMALGAQSESLHTQTKNFHLMSVELRERTNELIAVRQNLVERTDELVSEREALITRTQLLEEANMALSNETKSLVVERMLNQETHQVLDKTTAELMAVRQALVERTDELVSVRETLIARTQLLEKTNIALSNETAALIAQRDINNQTSEVLNKITYELVETRKILIERTAMLEEIVNNKL